MAVDVNWLHRRMAVNDNWLHQRTDAMQLRDTLSATTLQVHDTTATTSTCHATFLPLSTLSLLGVFLWRVQLDQVVNAQDGQRGLGGKLQDGQAQHIARNQPVDAHHQLRC